jgi:DNA-binding HxlR family transcriptional regulator
MNEGQRRDPVVYLYDPERCPFTATWSVIGGKWKGILWWRLANGLGRFGELQRAVPQITRKMLAAQLRELERDGIVRRVAYDEVPPRVEYSLTEHGRSLAPVVRAICEWGGGHLERRALAAPPGGGRSSQPSADQPAGVAAELSSRRRAATTARATVASRASVESVTPTRQESGE